MRIVTINKHNNNAKNKKNNNNNKISQTIITINKNSNNKNNNNNHNNDIYVPRASASRMLISYFCFSCQNCFSAPLIFSSALGPLLAFLHIFCHLHPLFVLSTDPLCKEIQIPHEFHLEIDEVATKRFGKQTLSHSSSVLKLTLVDGPSWQSYFSDGAFSQYKWFFLPRQKRFFPIQTLFYPCHSFGKFWMFYVDVRISQMVRKVAIRGLTTHANHVNPFCFQLITCNRLVGFLSTWLFLIIGARTFFEGSGVFFSATIKINAVPGKNQKDSTRKA